jgi:ATP-dependent RNA helicase DeaD
MKYENKHIEKALTEMGFEEFTEIQAECIPLINEGKDVIGHSQTGTGKTAAFALPILEKLDYDNNKIQAIILCPTRELAVQVKREIDKIGKYVHRLKTVCVYGGEPIHRQIQSLKKKPQIIIGTPGRTIDHINRKLIKLQDVSFVVLDEADEMLKMGFKEDIEIILGATNSTHQTTMFSATMPRQILNITKKYMNNPIHVSVVGEDETNKDITQYYYNVKEQNKVEAVSRLLHIYNPDLTLIFCNTKRKVDDVTRELTKKGYNVDKIHGDLQQTSRLHVLNKFHNGVLDILVATDVAARGLDIKNVGVVINFDVPEKAEYYVHRIGRTGRIGNKGYSFTLVSRKEMSRLDQIFRFTKSNIKRRNIPTPEKVIAVKQDKEFDEISELIKNQNTNRQFDLASKLLESNDHLQLVCALLNKLEKKDTSGKIIGDINEDISRSKSSSNRNNRGAKGRANSKDTVRFHINVGTGMGLTPKKFSEFITNKTKLRNQQVKEITVRHSFSFFTVNKKFEKVVFKTLTNITYQGKKTSIQLARLK